MRRAALLLLMALCGCAAQAPTQGAGCAVSKLADVPLERERLLPIVPVTVDGQPLRLVFDTGAERTLILAHVADRLALFRDRTRRVEVRGVGPTTVSYDVRPRTFQFGPLTLDAPALAVGRFRLKTDGPEPDGLLGLDVISRFDVDFDPAAGRLTLYAPRTCDAAPAGAGARWELLAAEVNRFGSFVVPTLVDGAKLRLTLDTGAEQSLLSVDGLDAVGLDQRTLGTDPFITLAGMSPAMTEVRLHRFGALRAGSVRADAPAFALAPLSPFYGDGLLGSDVLGARRLWLSAASEKVWVAAQ